MSGALLNGQLRGSSGLGIPAGLKMSERVIELIFLAEDIARTQSYATINALDGLVRSSAQGMSGPEKTMRVREVGTDINGSAERIDCL